ncbi:MAG: purine-nucleoside phosphorylase [Kineosporiaceae bacterium]
MTTSTSQAAERATADLRLSPDQLARHAADAVAAAAGPDAAAPDVAVVLGSGWKPAADLLGEVLADLPATDVPGFRPAAVAGHAGRLRLVRTGDGARVLVLGARTHLYEGHGVDAVAHGVRTAAAAGCRAVVLTNGCGSTVREWGPGTVVLVRDHLNLTGATPLRGPRFVDMSDAYAARLRAAAREVEPALPEGVYAQFHGPQYETPAEVRMARILGADLVGMSTAVETIAAGAEGLEVLGMSLVTNLAAGTTDAPLDHEEVLAAGAAAAERCGPLLAGVVDAVARATAP